MVMVQNAWKCSFLVCFHTYLARIIKKIRAVRCSGVAGLAIRNSLLAWTV